jgi:hypothetical protein
MLVFNKYFYKKEEVKVVLWRPYRCPKRLHLPNRREYIYSISSQYVRACAVARVLPSSCSSRLFQFSLPTLTVAGGSAPSRSRQRQMRVTNRHSKKIAKVHCGALLCSADLDVKDHAPTPASQPSSSSARLGTAVGTQQQAPWWGCLPPRFVYAGARASGC